MRPLIAVCVLLIPALADAEPDPPIRPSAVSVETVSGYGFGGLTSRLGELSTVGLDWNARIGVNFARFLGVELDYQGAYSSVTTAVVKSGVPVGSGLYADIGSANLKLGAPIPVGSHVLRPYVFGGGGYGYLSSSSWTTGPHVSTQNRGAFPLGAGVTLDSPSRFLIDARYSYNIITSSAGNLWDVIFSLGWRFGG